MLFKSIVLGQIAAFASASTIYRECLQYTDAAGGNADDSPGFEHYGPSVTEMPLHDSAMRVSEIKVCTTGITDDLLGLSMTLSDPSLGTSSSVEVPWLGKREGRNADCETVSVE